jgi:integrase
VVYAAAKRAGILNSDSFPHDSLSPHDLRHTFGARFLQRGGDIFVLSKMLGHSSVQVTQRHYAFIAPDDVGAKMLAVMEPDRLSRSGKSRIAERRYNPHRRTVWFAWRSRSESLA